jgi:TolB protein
MLKTRMLVWALVAAMGALLAGCAAPSAGRIAYEYHPNDQVSDIYIIQPDGKNAKPIIQNQAWNGTPALSPDGTRIAFASDRDGNAELYVMNVDGTGLKRLTDNPGPDMFPAWSPDGKRIVFCSERMYKSPLKNDMMEVVTGMSVYFIDPDGSNLQRLGIPDPGLAAYPSWSPDGKRVAYMTVTDRQRIWVCDVSTDPVEPADLTPYNYNEELQPWTPRWAGGGRYIVFMGQTADRRDIYRMDADGKNLVNLTPGWAGLCADPAVSPDGQHIVFASDKGGPVNLFVMDINGRNATQITFERTMITRPSWSR